MATKKNAAAKTAKKVPAPKPAKVAKTGKMISQGEAAVKLVSFTISAVIPTQQYGNIQPRIEVTAPSMELARSVVMPMIEDLYKTYAEMPLNGKEPKFYGNIVVEEKIITPGPTPTMPASTGGPVPFPHVVSETTAKVKSEPVLKAEKAISLATTDEAAELIQKQISDSVKIAAEDKPELLTLVLKKRKELKK